ncbi:hypothetical protein JT327_gp40 [Aeromonas phage LAh_7]|uniref:Uncharacterized protein n=1 Tax=Aeromonas phage LAh_7 TaxID=2591031 RepID=A0A514A0D4_9CAUD|nr:hypothetical protein JT327_gp40 [Aeromonas phage LAh_7]QDH46692.1 hypothetical protein LAh7_40 [Aeromonas phage LAh_7]
MLISCLPAICGRHSQTPNRRSNDEPNDPWSKYGVGGLGTEPGRQADFLLQPLSPSRSGRDHPVRLMPELFHQAGRSHPWAHSGNGARADQVYPQRVNPSCRASSPAFGDPACT